MNPSNPLDQLRAIHGPPKPGFWPPSWEFWLLVFFFVLGIAGLVYWYLQQQGPRWYQEAQRQLRPLYAQLPTNPSALVQINQLLKQVAMTISDRASVANLQGQAWCQWLDQQGKCNHFTQGVGQCFGRDLYNPDFKCSPEFAALLQSTLNQWLQQQKIAKNAFAEKLKAQPKYLKQLYKIWFAFKMVTAKVKAWRKPRHE